MNWRNRGASALSAGGRLPHSYLDHKTVIMYWTHKQGPAYCGGVLDDITRQAAIAAKRDEKLRQGGPGMRRVRLGLFAAGTATFSLMYAPQPLLPQIASTFRANPASASLAMTAATLAAAIAIIPLSSLSEACGRRRVMVVAALASSAFGLAAALAPSLPALVAIRVAQGVALAGVPSVAVAYLAEEVEAGSLGRVIGLFLAGNSVGALSGRIVAGVLSDHGGWRVALAGVGAVSVSWAIAFAVLLPQSAHFRPAPLRVRGLLASLRQNVSDSRLLRLYVISFTMTGALVTVYTYLTFRLAGRPFGLSPSVLGFLFAAYLAGTWSSAAAGRLAERHGRFRVLVSGVLATALGTVFTLSGSLLAIVAGLVILTAGWFAAHSAASAWVGARAEVAPAQASALYSSGLYFGSSVAGYAGGLFYDHGGWPATVAFVLALIAVALTSASSLRR
jgi:MFS transporter, YNFM family, putative membrane transport protein